MNIDKIIKKIGKDTKLELDDLSPEQLNARVVLASQAMKQATDELEANEKYQELKESLKALTSGKREVNARQNGIIAYCLHLLAKE